MTDNDRPQQLSLLPSSGAPIQFRLDAETRRRGLRHVAEIRRQLAERQARRIELERTARRTPPRRDAA